jgi:hypothetical protein
MTSKVTPKKTIIFQASLAFVGLCILQLTTWIPLRYWSAWGGGNFLDSWQILRYAECYESFELSVYENSGSNCSNYLYGRSLLQLLAYLRVDVTLTQFFGYTFLLFLAVGLTLVFPIKNQRDFLLFALVLFSPPVMLLADRGNFDILIFFVLILVAKSAACKNFFLANFLLSITVLMKYYTAPVFLLLIFYSKILKDRILGIVFLLTCSGLALRDIAITAAPYPQGSDAQFGFAIWGEYLNKTLSTQLSEIQSYSISTVFLISTLFLTFIFSQKYTGKVIEIANTSDWEILAFWIFLIVSISCYFGGMNFDYRLIYFASTFLLARRVLTNSYPRALENSLIIVLWLSFPSGGLQPLGDLVIEIAVSFTLIILLTEARKKIKYKLL